MFYRLFASGFFLRSCFEGGGGGDEMQRNYNKML